jgi:hypothetical protein
VHRVVESTGPIHRKRIETRLGLTRADGGGTGRRVQGKTGVGSILLTTDPRDGDAPGYSGLGPTATSDRPGGIRRSILPAARPAAGRGPTDLTHPTAGRARPRKGVDRGKGSDTFARPQTPLRAPRTSARRRHSWPATKPTTSPAPPCSSMAACGSRPRMSDHRRSRRPGVR